MTLAVTDPVIVFSGVRKRYGSVKVLQGLDLQVQRGEVFGFLGKNGAGKSTAIRILMGITQADGGQMSLFGESISSNRTALRQRIGYVAQEQNFYGWMTPRSLARFLSGFYPKWNPSRFVTLTDAFDVPRQRRISTFSGGMKTKLALTVALAAQPELLVLDEPTAGMDPVARREFLDLVLEQAITSGATIFFSTHLIDEIEAVADRIAIVDGGRSIYSGSLATLTNSIAAYSVADGESLPDTLPGNFALAAHRVLQDVVRRGRRTLILQFTGTAPRHIGMDPGWQAEALTLEDIFVAVVSA